MSTIQLDIPARPGYVGVVRLAIASLARQEGLDEEKVDELKIVVSEACTNAVMAHEEAGVKGSVSVRWSAEDDGPIRLEIEDTAGRPAMTNLEDSQGFSTRVAMSVALLQSLVEGYETSAGDNGSVTTLTLTR